jgi:hypothetical protein
MLVAAVTSRRAEDQWHTILPRQLDQRKDHNQACQSGGMILHIGTSIEVVLSAPSLPLSMGSVEAEVTCKLFSDGTRLSGARKVSILGGVFD